MAKKFWGSIFSASGNGERPVTPTYADHYFAELKSIGGTRRELTLADCEFMGPAAQLNYQWSVQLSESDADRLDSRVRAFAACAIYDAAVEAGCSCTEGPPHGHRPSWMIGNFPAPIGVVQAGFSTPDKKCWVVVGPIIMRPDIMSVTEFSKRLADGFRKRFPRIIA